jgi:transposase
LPKYIPTTGKLICPHCSGEKIVSNGAKKDQIFVDLPAHGAPSYVAIDRQRYRCTSCKKTFLEKLEGIDDRRNISLRLIAYIEKQSLNRSYLSVAREVGLSEGTIRRIFSEYFASLEANFRPRTPDYLSFDLINLIGKTRYLPCNFKFNGIVGFLEDTSKEALEAYLKNLEEKWRVKIVVIDMNPVCRELVRTYLPGAKIVVNPGHILNTVLQILENMRKELRKSLSPKELRLLANDRLIIQTWENDLTEKDKVSIRLWKQHFNRFATAYLRKEELRKLFWMDNKKAAMDVFLNWQKNVLADGITEYMPVIDSIFEWQEEVTGWFEFNPSIKNKHYGFVEGMETAINTRLERGYSYDAIKARMLTVKRIHPERGIFLGAVKWSIDKEFSVNRFS